MRKVFGTDLSINSALVIEPARGGAQCAFTSWARCEVARLKNGVMLISGRTLFRLGLCFVVSMPCVIDARPSLSASILPLPREQQLQRDNIDRASHAFREAAEAEAAGNLKTALDRYSRGIEALPPHDPRLAVALNMRCVILYKMRRFDEAANDCDRATSLSPRYAAAYANKGLVDLERGRLAAAVEEFSRYIVLKPLRADGYSGRGIALDRLGRPKEAIADFTKALEIEPSDPNTHFNRGNAFVNAHKLRNAIADYSAAIAGDPTQSDYYRARADASDSLNRTSKARRSEISDRRLRRSNSRLLLIDQDSSYRTSIP